MTLKNKIMKLQTYKMFEDEDTVYVERDDVLKALEQIELNPSENAIGMDAVIEWLKNKDIIKLSSQEKIARKELKELLSVTPRNNLATTSQDCVSRQAAIDVVRKWFDKIQLNSDICLDGIISLPSVTPKTEPCEDYIKRADVLKYAQLIRDDEGIVHEMVHVDDIKDASSVTWSGWTPATQLPEPSTAVLLHVKYKSSGQWTYQLGMWNDNKQAWEDWRTPYQLEEEFEVIAWMELPEKYEEGEDE